MTAELRLSPDLALPLDAVTEAFGVVGVRTVMTSNGGIITANRIKNPGGCANTPGHVSTEDWSMEHPQSTLPELPDGSKSKRLRFSCERCGCDFFRYPSQLLRERDKNPRFCSRACSRVPRLQLVCAYCGSHFELKESETTGDRGTYCSLSCQRNARKNQVELNCAQCGKAFSRKDSEVGPGPQFCTRLCYDAYRSANSVSYPKIGSRHAHRLVAERKLGRPLLPGEVVHHKDEDKQNYDESNLEVLPSQAEHARLHFTGQKFSDDSLRKRTESRRSRHDG